MLELNMLCKCKYEFWIAPVVKKKIIMYFDYFGDKTLGTWIL